MLEPYGSKDDLSDIVDLLDKTEAHYIMIVGIPGERRTFVAFSNTVYPEVALQHVDQAHALLKSVIQ